MKLLSKYKLLYLIMILIAGVKTSNAQEISLKNNKIERKFKLTNNVWKTTAFVDIEKRQTWKVNSDEFYILPLAKNQGYTINDFESIGSPNTYSKSDTSFIQIKYQPKSTIIHQAAVPDSLFITYYLVKDEAYTRKSLRLLYNEKNTVDRLEVERMTFSAPAKGGGRGEPVFIDEQLFLGLEYPAGFSRHSDSNTPTSYGRRYDKVGNYSYIDLEGRDIEEHPIPGLVRLFHFPGYTKNSTGHHSIQSKVAATGVKSNKASVQHAFMEYLASIWKKPKSFLHYNNWFDQAAKDLRGDGLLNVFKEFQKAIDPFGIKMDAVVADDGWQNRKSIWEPSAEYFPNGISDVRKLSDKLKDNGVGFGVWLSLNGYTNNIDWGKEQGYAEADRNSHFQQFGRYYSLSDKKYKDEVLKKIPELTEAANLIYYKHDFNDLSDIGNGTNHPATDRHGHEANLDAAIEILLATRKVNPEIIQNLTNWVWFSPYWLLYSDYLWLLAGDDGENGNWPELSNWAKKTSDRDAYFWRMWADKEDRPLVPVSRIMTHGIIKTEKQNKQETLQDWADYVLMHYGRGTLLKEWYISPAAMHPDEWKVLSLTNNWTKRHEEAMNNTFYVGGRPDDGQVYGYIGWKDNQGVLTLRNPSATTQTIDIPFDETIGFEGNKNTKYRAKVVFPYIEEHPTVFAPGKSIELEVPGYATVAYEFEPGKPKRKKKQQHTNTAFTTSTNDGKTTSVVAVPDDVEGRADLLVIGYPNTVKITINGKEATAQDSSHSKLNAYPFYAKPGMINDKAKEWSMTKYNLLPYKGQKITIQYDANNNVESHLLLERKSKNIVPYEESKSNLWPLTNGTRRETIKLTN